MRRCGPPPPPHCPTHVGQLFPRGSRSSGPPWASLHGRPVPACPFGESEGGTGRHLAPKGSFPSAPDPSTTLSDENGHRCPGIASPRGRTKEHTERAPISALPMLYRGQDAPTPEPQKGSQAPFNPFPSSPPHSPQSQIHFLLCDDRRMAHEEGDAGHQPPPKPLAQAPGATRFLTPFITLNKEGANSTPNRRPSKRETSLGSMGACQNPAPSGLALAQCALPAPSPEPLSALRLTCASGYSVQLMGHFPPARFLSKINMTFFLTIKQIFIQQIPKFTIWKARGVHFTWALSFSSR